MMMYCADRTTVLTNLKKCIVALNFKFISKQILPKYEDTTTTSISYTSGLLKSLVRAL